MQIVYSDQEFPELVEMSIFLAGPSPRKKGVWDPRRGILEELAARGYKGTVYVPVPEKKFLGGDEDPSWTYDDQIEWECKARERADVVAFWVAREMQELPGFTTNIEFGEDLGSGKVVYGRPAGAPKCKYLDRRAQMAGISVHESIESLASEALERLGQGAMRRGGCASVPLDMWRSEQFGSWLAAQERAGNRLVSFRQLFRHPLQGPVFAFAAWVEVYVASENRVKANEFVFARSDVSAVLAHGPLRGSDTEILLVKEFRSPVKNAQGYVYELPSGSVEPGCSALENALRELKEEAGLDIARASRARPLGSRQCAAVSGAHSCALFALELDEAELAGIRLAQRQGKSFGQEADGECCWPLLATAGEIYGGALPVDFSVLGMVSCLLLGGGKISQKQGDR